MPDFTALRLTLLTNRYNGARVSDNRNGRCGTVTGVRLFYYPGRMWWASGLHLVVTLDAGGWMFARLNEVTFPKENR